MRASTANILFMNGVVHKTIGTNKYQKFNVYEREVFWLKRFQDADFVPDFVASNDRICSISMKIVGNSVSGSVIPEDFEEQLDNINKVLKEYNCQHNDINDDNILIGDNKIYLIDFGWSTFISDEDEDSSDKYFPFVSHENLNVFPRELNQFFLNNGKLDDDHAFNLVKQKLNEIRGNI